MGDCTPSWFDRRTSRWQDWPPRRLLKFKLQRGSRISAVIPARNGARTVAGVAGAISRSLIGRVSRPVPAHERPPAGSVPEWPGVQRPSALEPDAQQRNAQRRDGQR